MKSPKCAWPHTVVLEKKQSTQTGGNEEWLPAQHTQQQEVSAEELGNDANYKTAPRTWNRKVQEMCLVGLVCEFSGIIIMNCFVLSDYYCDGNINFTLVYFN